MTALPPPSPETRRDGGTRPRPVSPAPRARKHSAGRARIVTFVVSAAAFGVLTAGVAAATRTNASTASPSIPTAAPATAPNNAFGYEDPTTTAPVVPDPAQYSSPVAPRDQFIPPPVTRSRGS